MWLSVDPLASERSWLTPYNFVQNNPIMRIDPTGALDGDYYDSDGIHLGNDGIDDDKVYTVKGSSRFSINDVQEGGKYHNNQSGFSENNGSGYSINYEGTVSETKLSFTGEANSGNSKQADGTVNLIQVLDNGKEFTKQSLSAVGGPYGNGAPPNGDYTVDGPRLRSESGFTRDGFGFSFNLNPTFETGRTLLRIHPDGNNTGTLGCVGLGCSGTQGRLFYNNVRSAINKGGALNMNINITGNPNNHGGGFVPNINE